MKSMQAALLAAAVAAAVLSSRGASASVEAAKERVMELANSDDMVNCPPKKYICFSGKKHLKNLNLLGAPSRVDPFSQAQGRAAAGGAQGHCRAGTKFHSNYFYKRKK